jgi:hypothetical protein
MAACLADMSISASLSDQDDGQTRLDIDPSPGDDRLVWVLPDGSAMQLFDDEESTEMLNAAVSEGRSLLWLAGVDRTADLDACIEETQFTQPGPYADPATEQRLKQLQTDLNNDFAACARANGFPEVEDQPPPVLDGVTAGVASLILPWRMTEEELRDLLAECPAYDEGRIRELADGEAAGANWLEETIMGPVLGFKPPSFDNPDGVSDEEFPRWEGLEETMAEVQNSQLQELIDKLQAEGIRYDGPRPEAGFHWVTADD